MAGEPGRGFASGRTARTAGSAGLGLVALDTDGRGSAGKEGQGPVWIASTRLALAGTQRNGPASHVAARSVHARRKWHGRLRTTRRGESSRGARGPAGAEGKDGADGESGHGGTAGPPSPGPVPPASPRPGRQGGTRSGVDRLDTFRHGRQGTARPATT